MVPPAKAEEMYSPEVYHCCLIILLYIFLIVEDMAGLT